MKTNKKITSLVLRVQELVMGLKNFSVHYYSNISLLSIYGVNENGKYEYHESLYMDCSMYDEKYILSKLENIIKELEVLASETCSI